MSSKRKFSEFKTDSSSQDAPGERMSGRHNSKKAKNAKKSKAKPDSIYWMKKRARTIERRLKTGQHLPANVENDLERELAHHRQKIEELVDDKKRKMMIKKYHMVRFFERKKADRLAKQIQSQLKTAKDPKEIEKLNADLHKAEIDSLYARFFPFRERYVSLYPVASLGLAADGGAKPENASSAAQALHAGRPPLWEAIEKASEKGIPALVEIRERNLERDTKNKQATTPPTKDSISAKTKHSKEKKSDISGSAKSGKGKDKSRRHNPSDPPDSDGDDSEGGFFEEE